MQVNRSEIGEQDNSIYHQVNLVLRDQEVRENIRYVQNYRMDVIVSDRKINPNIILKYSSLALYHKPERKFYEGDRAESHLVIINQHKLPYKTQIEYISLVTFTLTEYPDYKIVQFHIDPMFTKAEVEQLLAQNILVMNPDNYWVAPAVDEWEETTYISSPLVTTNSVY